MNYEGTRATVDIKPRHMCTRTCVGLGLVCTSLEENVNDEETTKRVASCSHTMEDLEFQFDFENDLNADLEQPEEAPQSMPENARKNYRQVHTSLTQRVYCQHF